MTITHVGNGGLTTGTTNPLTPALPSGLQDHDLVGVIVFDTDAVTHTMSAEWTEVYDGNPGGVGARAMFSWTDYNSAAPPSTTVTKAAGSATWGVLSFAYRPSAGFACPAVESWIWIPTAASTTANWESLTPVDVNRMCVFVLHTNTSITVGAISGTDPAPTERFDGQGLMYADGIRTASTATGARTATISFSAVSTGALLLLVDHQGPLALNGPRLPDPWMFLL